MPESVRPFTLPLHIFWSGEQGKLNDPMNRADRAAAHRAVITAGDGTEIDRYIDGRLLIDIWDEIILPWDILEHWAPLVADVRGF